MLEAVSTNNAETKLKYPSYKTMKLYVRFQSKEIFSLLG